MSEPFAQAGAAPAGFPSKQSDLFEDEAYLPNPPPPRSSLWDKLSEIDWTLGLDRLLRRRSRFEGVQRDIALNDPSANKVKGFESNSVSTGKYGPITFIPKFLFCEPSSVLPLMQPNFPVRRTSSFCLQVRQLPCTTAHSVHTTGT